MGRSTKHYPESTQQTRSRTRSRKKRKKREPIRIFKEDAFKKKTPVGDICPLPVGVNDVNDLSRADLFNHYRTIHRAQRPIKFLVAVFIILCILIAGYAVVDMSGRFDHYAPGVMETEETI